MLAAGSLFVNMNQATRFKAAPRATSGILGSHTETNTPCHSRVIPNHRNSGTRGSGMIVRDLLPRAKTGRS